MRLRLQQVREKKGLSLRALAERAGMDFSTVHRIETGKATPRLATLERLAKALGVLVRDLLQNGK